MTRTIIIGDVHGCLDEMDELLRIITYTKADRLIFAGDLLDRGPDPVGVVRRARELDAESVLGNHEEKHLRYQRHEARVPLGHKNPMRPMKGAKLAQHRALCFDDWSYLARLPLYIRFAPGWVLVHAGMRPGVRVEDQEPNALLRMRYLDRTTGKMRKLDDELSPVSDAYWSTVWTGPESVVYGHHVHRGVAVDEPAPGVRCLGIDTGCCFGRSLTAAIFESGEFKGCADVPARDVYCVHSDAATS